MPNVWYAKCHEMAIAHVAKTPYLCTIEINESTPKTASFPPASTLENEIREYVVG